MQANVVTRGRLACEGSACPLPCGGHELDIALLFRLSPKAALNLLIVENHTILPAERVRKLSPSMNVELVDSQEVFRLHANGLTL
jgi:hypothetical protein